MYGVCGGRGELCGVCVGGGGRGELCGVCVGGGGSCVVCVWEKGGVLPWLVECRCVDVFCVKEVFVSLIVEVEQLQRERERGGGG